VIRHVSATSLCPTLDWPPLALFPAIRKMVSVPFLTLAGQFLLKDLGLMAAAVNVIAMAPVGQPLTVRQHTLPAEAA
jgi:uncharacterized membrane protein YkgB